MNLMYCQGRDGHWLVEVREYWQYHEVNANESGRQVHLCSACVKRRRLQGYELEPTHQMLPGRRELAR